MSEQCGMWTVVSEEVDTRKSANNLIVRSTEQCSFAGLNYFTNLRTRLCVSTRVKSPLTVKLLLERRWVSKKRTV